MQGIFQKENTDKALKYGIYRHLPTYEKIIRNLVSFLIKNTFVKEECLDEQGKINYDKLKPVLFEMPTYQYLSTGEVLGKCLKLEK
ncbi:hypothetical protein DW220_03655 [Eubacterium sp. AM18-26]|nr:hypothetical protein DW220_03655 [Eubacterium sp. AM18-26]RHO28491.1 hypothetical protein DW212_01620 [Eubacterium sp. AM18-10LB-B]